MEKFQRNSGLGDLQQISIKNGACGGDIPMLSNEDENNMLPPANDILTYKSVYIKWSYGIQG